MIIIRHSLRSAVVGALIAYGLGLALFTVVGHAHDIAPSWWPTGFMAVIVFIGTLAGGAAGVESGIIATDERARAIAAAKRRHPASTAPAPDFTSERSVNYHTWGVTR